MADKTERAAIVQRAVDYLATIPHLDARDFAEDVLALAAELDAAERIIRDALPSLGANRRSYAQRALDRGCAILGENPDAWRGGGELALEQEWRERIVALEKRNGELTDAAEEAMQRAALHLETGDFCVPNDAAMKLRAALATSGAGEET